MKHTGERLPRDPALLRCQGIPSCGDWVPHTFAEARYVPPASKDDTASREELYRCDVCGSLVRWGLLTTSAREAAAAKRGA